MDADRTIHVLLIEDDYAAAKVFTWALEPQGAICHVAYCIADAKILYQQSVEGAEVRFDAALLDLTLPDAKGLDSLRFFRQFCDIPTVVLTGLDDENNELALSAIAEGAQDWIQKTGAHGRQIVRALRLAIARDKLNRARMLTKNGTQ